MDRRGSLGRQFGDIVRATRRTLGWTQAQLGARVGFSQAWVSRIERGLAPGLGLKAVDELATHLGIRILVHAQTFALRERALQRDPLHALIVAYIARHLERAGWLVATEVEIGSGQYRGWIDILAFDSATGAVLVIEVKTELRDLGALQRQVGWYEREAWAAARRLGWVPRSVRSGVVLLATEANDGSVREFREGLRAWAPNGSAWLQACIGDPKPADRRRFIAMVDPLSRRRDWLIRTRRDGRRSRLPDADYAAFMERRRRRRARHAPPSIGVRRK